MKIIILISIIFLCFMASSNTLKQAKPHIFKKMVNNNINFFQINSKKEQKKIIQNQDVNYSNLQKNSKESSNNRPRIIEINQKINFFQFNSKQEQENLSQNKNLNTFNLQEPATESSNNTKESNLTLAESSENTNQTESLDYEILEHEYYGPEIDEVKSALNISKNRTLTKLEDLTQQIKKKIDKVTQALEKKINNFTERIINGSKELNQLLLLNELKLLKLSIEIIKSEINEIITEIYKLRAYLAKLLKHFSSSIKTICSLYKTCGECLRNKHCGWCQEIETCMMGDEKAPKFDLCQFYNYHICEGNNCLKYKNCESCLEDPFCGWCVDEGKNLEGCIPGLQDFSSCPKWFYSSFTEKPQCPDPLKKKKLEAEEMDFDNIPEEQRKLFFQQQIEIIEMDGKIEKVKKGLIGLEEKVDFYKKKYQNISRAINLTEINEMREEISSRKFKREIDELRTKLQVEKSHKNQTLNLNKTDFTKTIGEDIESEQIYTLMDLDNPETMEYLG